MWWRNKGSKNKNKDMEISKQAVRIKDLERDNNAKRDKIDQLQKQLAEALAWNEHWAGCRGTYCDACKNCHVATVWHYGEIKTLKGCIKDVPCKHFERKEGS